MKTVKTNIIPQKQTFVKLNVPQEVNYEAICVFTALGFFLDQDTYYKNEVCLRPATINTIDDHGFLIKSEPWFKWHYAPKDTNFDEVLNEFTDVFETIIDQQTKDKNVILPLSGGLDSRTQAVALKYLNKNVNSYSYAFKNGYDEAKISKSIAEVCNFPFQKFEIQKGYLWQKIEVLSKINDCHSEFTHPRQMAVIDALKPKGEVFSLGHWGDVLFDKQTDKPLSESEELELILKKILKTGGLELASKLWKAWSLEGEFMDYLKNRVANLLSEIEIEDSNAKIRAFKSLYWAPRWTTANLSIFEDAHPITLPYYHNKMCEFVCTVPEAYLADRQLQIAYIKKRNKNLANIIWEEQKPFNLFNYSFNKTPYNLPYKISNKLKRITQNAIGKPYVQRNWELQFLGEANDKQLQKYLLESDLDNLIPRDIIYTIYTSFKQSDTVKFSHPLSMLLTLSLWQLNRK